MSASSNMNKKTPKGTIDLFDTSFDQISFYKNTAEKLFKSYGGVGLETPLFEIRENLLGKYGDEAESKLVFNLEDCKTEKGEKYTLRYDLTVPKMRFIKSKNILSKRIYSIGKVYRRDNPSIGRYREFYQADFDIVGESSDSLVNEFILLKMATEFIQEVSSNSNFTILINDTNYLNYLLVDMIGIDPSSFKSICSSIDKLDKCTYDEIIPELMAKGFTDEQVKKLDEVLRSNEPLLPETAEKIRTIIDSANVFGFGNNIVFSPSLARGLDYYNGIIYEIKINDNSSTVISGGRYDDSKTTFIGISFGLTRMADLLSYKNDKEEWKEMYYLTALDEISFLTKLEWIKKCEYAFGQKMMINSEKADKKLVKTINYCITNRIRYIVILGSEIKEGKLILKDLKENIQTIQII